MVSFRVMRFVRWTALGSVLVAIVVSVLLAEHSRSSPQSITGLFGGGVEQTPWGPLGPADRLLLIKVRQADLWEGPTGEQVAHRATSPAVREVGRKLGIEHAELDAKLRVVADKLGVALPSQPSDAQKVAMFEINRTSPADYDKKFVDLVRSAHGEVMPLVQGSRAGTQNELIRQFASEAAEVIGRHMGYLESTGLVDFALFAPSTADTARHAVIGGFTVPTTLVLFVLTVALSAMLLRAIRPSRPGVGARAEDGGRRAPISPRRGLGRLGVSASAGSGANRDLSRLVTTAELLAAFGAGTRPYGPDRPAPLPAGDGLERMPPRLGRGRAHQPW